MKKSICLLFITATLFAGSEESSTSGEVGLSCSKRSNQYAKDSITYDEVDEDEEPAASPEQIEKELTSLEEEFQQAKQMFQPWDSGPLIAGSGNVLGMGLLNMQAYAYFTDNYGTYTSNRKSKSHADLFQINPVMLLQAGILPRVDATVTLQSLYTRQSQRTHFDYGDTGLSFGIALVTEGVYMPAMKLGLAESFPTGNYRNLNSTRNGVDSTGSGSFATTIGFNVSKVIWWWWLLHPLSVRLALAYKIPAKVTVRGFNAYGGGFGARGKVNPGNQFSGDLGLELVIVPTFNVALDIQYIYTGHSSFSGNPGTDSNGNAATNSLPSNDQLILAPALEYVPDPNTGFIAGVIFTVTGRNSSALIQTVFSYTHAW